jgi:hypothetical protein
MSTADSWAAIRALLTARRLEAPEPAPHHCPDCHDVLLADLERKLAAVVTRQQNETRP